MRKNHLLRAAVIGAFAVPTPFATPSPNIPRPLIIPSIGPGSTMTERYSVAIKAGIMKMTPLAARSPATRNDLCFLDTTYAAVANPNTPSGGGWGGPWKGQWWG
jgi:hypothetical protein